MKKFFKNVNIIKIFVLLLTLMVFSCSKINDILDPETKTKREEKEKIILEKCKNYWHLKEHILMECTQETGNFIFMAEVLKNLTDFLLFRREINY